MDRDPRFLRLHADHESMQELVRRSRIIAFETVDTPPGAPPEKYVVTFKCKGIKGIDRTRMPIFTEHHQVAIHLHAAYPARAPLMRWLTDIWHPNISHTEPKHVCVNEAWWAPARGLDNLVLMLGEMVQYKNYWAKDEKPYPLDQEVAAWVRWAEAQGILGEDKPVDDRELLDPSRVRPVSASRPAEAAVPSRVRVVSGEPASADTTAAEGRAHGRVRVLSSSPSSRVKLVD